MAPATETEEVGHDDIFASDILTSSIATLA